MNKRCIDLDQDIDVTLSPDKGVADKTYDRHACLQLDVLCAVNRKSLRQELDNEERQRRFYTEQLEALETETDSLAASSTSATASPHKKVWQHFACQRCKSCTTTKRTGLPVHTER